MADSEAVGGASETSVAGSTAALGSVIPQRY